MNAQPELFTVGVIPTKVSQEQLEAVATALCEWDNRSMGERPFDQLPDNSMYREMYLAGAKAAVEALGIGVTT